MTLLISVIHIGSSQAQTSVSFQVFYDELSPYGNWVSYPDYGYVWVPYANTGFRPYASSGHWVYTEDGWAWVSDYRWGWAAFHYGNWFYDDSYGWMWAPGYEWAPAWVTWGEYQGNYCWAPIGPRVNISVSYSTYRPPYQYWNFCPRDRITSTRISNYYVNSYRNTTVINNITVINNVNRGGGGRPAYIRGPEPRSVERFTHQNIRPVTIQTVSRPGTARVEGGRLAIYRPNVQRNDNGNARPAAVRDLRTLQPGNRTAPPPRTAATQPFHNRQPNQPGQQPGRQQPGQQPQTREQPPTSQQQRPAQQPVRPAPQPRQEPQQPSHPAQQPARPVPQHRTMPQQPQQRPTPQQPNPMPQQPRPAPQQPRPAPQQPGPVPQERRPEPQQRPMMPPPQQRPQPQSPRPAPQQPRPAPAPRPVNPPPHQPPPHAENSHEHHR